MSDCDALTYTPLRDPSFVVDASGSSIDDPTDPRDIIARVKFIKRKSCDAIHFDARDDRATIRTAGFYASHDDPFSMTDQLTDQFHLRFFLSPSIDTSNDRDVIPIRNRSIGDKTAGGNRRIEISAMITRKPGLSLHSIGNSCRGGIRSISTVKQSRSFAETVQCYRRRGNGRAKEPGDLAERAKRKGRRARTGNQESLGLHLSREH